MALCLEPPLTLLPPSRCRLRLARMNEEMRESEGLYGQPGQHAADSHTEMQYRKCMQEFISLQLEEA